MISTKNVLAVSITYNPNIAQLNRQIQSIVKNNVDLLLVDNGSQNISEIEHLISGFSGCYSVCILKLSDNFGIAFATNQGFLNALERNYDYVCTFDQDSIPSHNYVVTALLTYEALEANGYNPIIVTSHKLNSKNYLNKKTIAITGAEIKSYYVECIELQNAIASGALFSLTKWRIVGEQCSKLFIDLVDTEWMYRARGKGFRLFGIVGQFIDHSLGDGTFKFFGRTLTLHSPLRHYYRSRNTLFLCKMSYVPLFWKIKSPISMFYLGVACSFYDKRNGFRHLFFVLKGFRDGVIGRMGRITLE